jgi:hypothetical protein
MNELRRQGRQLLDQVREHPYQALLVAAGVGYILGGGLFTRFTLTAIQAGVRLGALPLVQRQLLGVASAEPDPASTLGTP